MTMKPPPSPSLFTLVYMAVLGILSINMVFPSLANMAGAFGITYAQASLSISLFMILTAGLQLVIGPLSDLYGRRPVLLISTAIFTLASIGTALAPDFNTFMVFRVLQTAVIAGNVLSRAIVRDTAPPMQATQVLGTIGMAIALGPMLAPMAGGVLDQLFGWRSTLWAFAALGAGLLWLCWVDVPETNQTAGRGFAVHFRSYPALLGDMHFWSYTMSVAIGLGIFMAFLAGTPILGTARFGLSESAIGAMIGLPPVGFLLGSYLSRLYGARVPTAKMVMIGRLVSALGMVAAVALWRFGPGTAWTFFLLMPIVGVANGLTMPAGTAGAMSVRPDLAGSAAGLSGAVAIGFGGVMTSVAGSLMSADPDPARLLWLLFGLSVFSIIVAMPALRSRQVAEAIG